MAGNTTEEQAASALFALVTSAVTFKRKERHFRLPKDVSPAQTPALFQVQSRERNEYRDGGLGMPAKRTLVVDLLVYVTDAANTVAGVTTVGATQLNTIIQSIRTALLPDNTTTNCQTFGGLVASARIEGEIEYFAATEFDGLSSAAIPVSVLIP